MASSRDRQRKMARAKLDRQMARRAAALRRKRRIQAGVGVGLAVVLLAVGGFWALGGFDKEPAAEASDTCLWTSQSPGTNVDAKDVGQPPTKDVPTLGNRPMTITTNQGEPITVDLDLAAAPCAAVSFTHLASKSFYDNTTCHEITAEGALRCGDPSGKGQGGPTYTFPSEDVPAGPDATPSASPAPGQPPTYPKGTVALYPNPPGANGSQFLIFFKDFTPTETPTYSIVGKVTGGLATLDKIGAIETVDDGNGAKVKPKTDVLIQSLTVGDVVVVPSAEPGDPSASPSAPAATASPSPTSAS